ncbi:MAG: hypothetical protein CLLPBCKN_007310 [Chroococcidiopsis cubana SAG 39.79]|nr:hypothetical protein [Chroococcidiopsis cubana SAG 39.79]
MYLDNFCEKDRVLQVYVSANLEYLHINCIITINLEVKCNLKIFLFCNKFHLNFILFSI